MSALSKESRQVDDRRFLYRVLTLHSAKPLPSAQYLALDKEIFADSFFVDKSLSSATFGKAFAFAECSRHSGKVPTCSSVMMPLFLWWSTTACQVSWSLIELMVLSVLTHYNVQVIFWRCSGNMCKIFWKLN